MTSKFNISLSGAAKFKIEWQILKPGLARLWFFSFLISQSKYFARNTYQQTGSSLSLAEGLLVLKITPKGKSFQRKAGLMSLTNENVEIILSLVVKASEAIIKIYNQPEAFDTIYKDDNSPLTKADITANKILTEGLQKLFPKIPIVSEEGITTAPKGEPHWILDPLDGTKEFVKKNDEFTVNCGLIENGRPCFGVVGVPAQKKIYWSYQGKAYLRNAQDIDLEIRTRNIPDEGVTALVSRSHPGKETKILGECFPTIEYKGVGSALKICQIAEGLADIHLRTFQINEWDCAAAQYILESAGGKMLDLSGKQIPYGRSPVKLPRYIAISGALQSDLPRLIQKIENLRSILD